MFEIELIICIKIDLALNNLQKLICHKTQSINQPTFFLSIPLHSASLSLSLSLSRPTASLLSLSISYFYCILSLSLSLSPQASSGFLSLSLSLSLLFPIVSDLFISLPVFLSVPHYPLFSPSLTPTGPTLFFSILYWPLFHVLYRYFPPLFSNSRTDIFRYSFYFLICSRYISNTFFPGYSLSFCYTKD